ncbi:MAG: universal stress protein [Sulfuritalea sp.]|nr:universal stress protein [Sulfuritalea sp.]
MKPLARILAATDLSAPAGHAVDRGFRIAAATGARYSVMHTLELDAIDALREWLGEESVEVKRKLGDQARDALSRLLADPARNHGVAAAAMIVSGPPLATILAQAEASDADLLVLGARGGDYLRHLLLGTTASRLLRKVAGRAVLMVKQPAHEAYRRLLIPVDFSPVSARAIQFARQLAPAADIFLLHAFEAPFEGKLAFAGVEDEVMQRYRAATREGAMRRMRHLADMAGLSSGDYAPLVLHGDASQQTLAQEQELDCDLIVMGKHGKHVTEELLLGSMTKHILAESQCDVLVIGDEKAPVTIDNHAEAKVTPLT